LFSNRKPRIGATGPKVSWAQAHHKGIVAMFHGHSLSPAACRHFQPYRTTLRWSLTTRHPILTWQAFRQRSHTRVNP